VNHTMSLKVLGVAAFLSAGLLLTGCKPAPDLTKADAQALIQAKYDQTPPSAVNIVVDQSGLARGITAGYWARTKVYPNGYWADFMLTPAGKKLVTLQKGGDVIQWHPENAGDKNFSIVVVTVATSHLKAHDVGDPQDEAGGTKGAVFVEASNVEGLPNDLQIISTGPGNQLSIKRMASFALDSGAWKLQSIH